jgi:hypothetical protein
MEATANYNENNAFILELKKSRRTKRILWKLNFILLCNSVLINLKFSPQFHWFWFSAIMGFGLVMHALQVFWLQTNWEERKLKRF